MTDFRSRLNAKKGVSVPPPRKVQLDREADALAEYIRNYIENSIAPYTPHNQRVCAEVFLTHHNNNLDFVRTELPANGLLDRHLNKTLAKIELNEESVYLKDRLTALLRPDGFAVGKWCFMTLRDRSSDDYGENFYPAPHNWCMYPQNYFAPAASINPEQPFTHQYVYSFGHKHTYIQGAARADVSAAGYVGFVVSFRE